MKTFKEFITEAKLPIIITISKELDNENDEMIDSFYNELDGLEFDEYPDEYSDEYYYETDDKSIAKKIEKALKNIGVKSTTKVGQDIAGDFAKLSDDKKVIRVLSNNTGYKEQDYRIKDINYSATKTRIILKDDASYMEFNKKDTFFGLSFAEFTETLKKSGASEGL